jgi:hypothetical protein
LKRFSEILRLFLNNVGFSKIARLFKFFFSGIEVILKCEAFQKHLKSNQSFSSNVRGFEGF